MTTSIVVGVFSFWQAALRRLAKAGFGDAIALHHPI